MLRTGSEGKGVTAPFYAATSYQLVKHAQPRARSPRPLVRLLQIQQTNQNQRRQTAGCFRLPDIEQQFPATNEALTRGRTFLSREFAPLAPDRSLTTALSTLTPFTPAYLMPKPSNRTRSVDPCIKRVRAALTRTSIKFNPHASPPTAATNISCNSQLG
jgi:hypothetical protein